MSVRPDRAPADLLGLGRDALARAAWEEARARFAAAPALAGAPAALDRRGDGSGRG